jgi:hypothetical protein
MAAANKRSGTPPAGKVRVKILPKDPLVARKNGLWPIQIDLPCLNPGDGPTGPHAVVVDYNADLDARFAPAQLQKNRSFKGISRLSNDRILEDFTFHQVNVWAIVEQTLSMIENEYLMARTIPWASQFGRLILLPHAGYEQNAFYDRGTGAIHFLYFQGPDGKPVYTCLSHDIIAHELGHAVLDGLKPYYNEFSSPETAGFHEYFGDAVAMMSSLNNRETAKVVTRGNKKKLDPQNVVSAIASEFGAAIRDIPDEEYLRGAWNNQTVKRLRGTFEEHDWSEILTGVYYDLLEYLYPRVREQIVKEERKRRKAQYYSMRALSRVATITAGVMFRALDYCPPVDLRYKEYARAILRADAVAYPLDDLKIRGQLLKIFKRRGILPPTEDPKQIGKFQQALSNVDIDTVATPADAYRFLDRHRKLFGIPYDANFCVPTVFKTNKRAKGGYRPPKEHIIEFVWSEDIKLEGRRFGPLAGTLMPLYCGGTVVFDSNGNFLHQSIVLPTDQRKAELKRYAKYLIDEGEMTMAAGGAGVGAPGVQGKRFSAEIDRGRIKLTRNPAMRHARRGSRRKRS